MIEKGAVKTGRIRGVTLIEVLIAMMIILIVELGCIQVLQFNSKATLSVFKKIQAGQYLDQIHTHLRISNVAKLEDRYQKFPQIINDADYSAEVTVAKADEDGTRKATIIVRWSPDPAQNFIQQDVMLTPK